MKKSIEFFTYRVWRPLKNAFSFFSCYKYWLHSLVQLRAIYSVFILENDPYNWLLLLVDCFFFVLLQGIPLIWNVFKYRCIKTMTIDILLLGCYRWYKEIKCLSRQHRIYGFDRNRQNSKNFCIFIEFNAFSWREFLKNLFEYVLN